MSALFWSHSGTVFNGVLTYDYPLGLGTLLVVRIQTKTQFNLDRKIYCPTLHAPVSEIN